MKKPITYLTALILCFTFLRVASSQDLTISTNTTWEPATYTYDNVLITSAATLTFNGQVILNARNLSIDSGSTISANGKGYSAGQGPGSGGYPGGGGSYGGKGANGWWSPSGPTYGSAIAPEDLGSGGDRYSWQGGPGGGAIKLVISGTLTLNGKISANGNNDGGSYYGGGSGGSVYIIANQLTGSGIISANGGNGGYGGGGGGRIAYYYQTSTFTGKAEAKGGLGSSSSLNGQDGTVVSSSDTPLASFTLVEKSSTTVTLTETLSTQPVSLTDINVTGDLNGNFNSTSLEIVKIITGSFANKGFIKGDFTATLDGISYNASIKGMLYPDPKENKLYLKGEVEEELNGILEGEVTESIPQSGNYDKFQGILKTNRLKTETNSVTLNFAGTITYQTPHTFSSELYFYQANMEGSCFGFYTGPLSAVVTHLRLTSENEYKGQGFSIISYNTTLGSSEGYAYNQITSPGRIEFSGLFNAPFLGRLSASLDETKSPKTLSGTIERLDLGVAPTPDLKVKVWGPQRVSPGQTVTYIIEYRNDGLRAADNVFVSCLLNTFEKYVYASPGAIYNPYAHRLCWKIPTLAAKSSGLLSFQTEIMRGLPGHTFLNTYAFITNIGE